METITIKTKFQGEVTIPAQDTPQQREYSETDRRLVDVPLHAQVVSGYPIGVTILLRSDGSWVHWETDFQSNNRYLHFACGFEERAAEYPPTEAQRRTLARWWLRQDRPYGLTISGPVSAWAFQGFTPDEISARYGTGRPVYLTAQCDDAEAIGPPAKDDELDRREQLLEQAVEEGQITGGL